MLESIHSVVVSDDDSVTVTMNDDANTTLVFPNFDEVHEFIRQLSLECEAVTQATRERNDYIAKLTTLVDAMYKLSEAYDTEHFNADDSFSEFDMKLILTCSLDELASRWGAYHDYVINR